MTFGARTATLAIGVAIALGGCGGGGGLSSAGRARLGPLVEQVRHAAESRDRQRTQHALGELRAAVATSEKNGDVSSARAAQILAAATEVQNRLTLIPTTTTITTTTTTTTPPDGHGHGNGKKGGEGNGGGND